MLRTLTSPRTTTILLILVAAVLAVITVLEAADATPRPSGSTYHLYGSWWMVGLLGILFLQLGACLLRRRLLHSPALLTAHLGLGLLLVGALLTARSSERGMVYLAENEQTNVLQSPGQLWIDAARNEEVVARTRLQGIQRDAPGKSYEIEGVGPGSLVRFVASSRVRNTLRSREDEIGVPGVSLDVATPHGAHEVVLAQGWADEAEIGSMRVVLGSSEGATPTEPSLSVTLDGEESVHPVMLPSDIGRSIKVGSLVATVLDYTPNFKVGGIERDGPPVNPALRVILAAPGSAPETLWVFSRFPGFARPTTPGVRGVEFVMPDAAGESLFLYQDAGSWRYRYVGDGRESEGTFAEGDTFFISPTPAVRVPMVVRQLLARSEVVPEVESAPDAPTAPAAVLLAFDRFEEPLWLIEGGPEVVVPGNDGESRALSLTSARALPFWIALNHAHREDYPNSTIPRAYESSIRIGMSPDSFGEPFVVKTNAPGRFGGWRIYQAEFGTGDDTAWSGLQVARDPGALVALIGVTLLTIGVAAHALRRGSRGATLMLGMAMLIAPAAQAAEETLPLADLVVSEGGRLKPLETLARDVEIELGVTFPNDPLTGFAAFALDPAGSRAEPVITVHGALAPALGLQPGQRLSIDDARNLQRELERLAASSSTDSSEAAQSILSTADRLGALEDMVTLAPGESTGGWWVPPTQATCPDWAVTRWSSLRQHYRSGRTAEAATEAEALIREQRTRLGNELPARIRVALEVWWRRLDPPRWAPWWVAAACVAHLVIAAGGQRTKAVTLVPIAAVTGLQALAVGTWIAFAGRLPLLNSWEVYFLVLFLVPALGLLVHRTTGMHSVSAVALVMTLIGSIGLRLLPATARIVRPPVAILQSSWREVHILSTMTSYALLFLAAGLSVALLVRPRQREIHRLTHWVLLAGTLLLGVGIATGAAWAYEAWGRYWGWDPKEVWALAAWLVFAAALHARASGIGGTRGWAGLVIVGFAALLFTFLGVTFLLPGLHSYG